MPAISKMPAVRVRRLALAKKVREALVAGCRLIGLPLVEEM